MLWILLAILSLVEATPVRICVPESLSSSCAEMAADLPDSFSCVTAPDMFRCLKKVNEGKADITTVDHSGMYVGGKYFNLIPIATEIIDGNAYRYQGIALVSRHSQIHSAKDLKNRASCHTGFKRTVGWQLPVSKLLFSGIMELDCNDGELGAAHSFFNGSCVPGAWTGDAVVDEALRRKYPGLCSRCKNPQECSKDDDYAGYEGVIRCLAEDAADVAFTKIPVLKKYLEEHPKFAETAQILCFEGGRKEVTDPEPCVWGSRPTNAYVAKSGDPEEIERLVSTLLNVQTRYAVPQVRTPDWYFKTFLSRSEVTALRRTEEERGTYSTYLGDFIHTIQKPRRGCEGKESEHALTFCGSLSEEMSKCEDVRKAMDGKGLWPNIACLQRDSTQACMEELKQGNVDMLVLDGGDVYTAGKYYDLQPLAKHAYKDDTSFYYSVAVLKSSSKVSSLSELKGLRSCHSGMGHPAGWVMPLRSLNSGGLLNSSEVCTHPGGVADFFSGGSCVPGADDPKYNPRSIKSEELCKQCVGDNEGLYKCSRDLREKYYGNAGALRCLVEGAGDVAFVKHFTVPEYTDENSQQTWAKDLKTADFKLLCSGSRTENVYNYTSCNMGAVPFRMIMVSSNIPENRRLHAASLMAEYSKVFSEGSSLYRTFYQVPLYNRLFKDISTGLKILPFGTSYQEALDNELIKSFEEADPRACT